METYESVRALAAKVDRSPELEAKIKANPAQALAELAGPLQTDVWIYRIVVLALGLAVLTALIGAITLTAFGKTIPDVLTALGSAALGALAGLLAPSPKSG